MNDLQCQVDEIEALRSMYDDCFILADAERQALAAAQALLVQPLAQQFAAPAINLSGSIRLPGALLAGSPVALHFQLPAGYPSAASPSLLVECAAPRLLHEQLTAAVNRTAEEAVGGEALLLVLSSLQEEVASACSTAAASPEHQLEAQAAVGGGSGGCSSAVCQCRLCIIVWFHHVKSLAKRRLICSWARELNINGAVKPGFPGVLVVVGPAGVVRDYVARIRGLKWQAMQTRGEQELKCSPCRAEQRQQQQEADERSAAGFTDGFVELPETGGMSELSKLCTAAGLEQLFLAALKLDKK